jgi:hypothetical protein
MLLTAQTIKPNSRYTTVSAFDTMDRQKPQKFSWDSLSEGPDFEPRPPEYSAGIAYFNYGVFASYFGMAHLQFAGRAEGLQIWSIAANI